MELKQFKEQLFVEGEKRGFSNVELYYEKTDKLSCDVYDGEVDGYESSTVKGASIRGLFKGKTGYAYTEKLDEDSVHFLLDHAAENALLIEDDPEELFTDSATYEQKQFYTADLETVSAEDKISFIKEVEEKILAYDPRVKKVMYAVIQDQTIEKGLFHNKGLSLNERNNFLMVGATLLVEEAGETKSGFYLKTTKDFAGLDADVIAKEAVEKGLSFLGGKNYPNKNYPVLLKNTAAASLLATFVPAFSARVVQDDQSRLKDQLGRVIAADCLTLIDDPFLADGIRSSTFDAEGVPTKKRTVVKQGELTTFFHNLKTAMKDSVQSTGHASRESYKGTIDVQASNLFVEPTDQSYEQLYAGMEEGIIITELAGLHSGANQISGEFSLAADGYYVKEGEVVGPVKQMTVAGNFFEVIKDVEQIGEDLDFSSMDAYGYIGSPSLKIKSLAITVD